MLKNKIKALLLASVIAMFASCSDDDQKPEPPIVGPIPPIDTVVPPPVDPIFPVDFNFITLNSNGWNGELPSISYIKKDNSILSDYFKDANGELIAENPSSATQIKEKLYIVQNSHWGMNNIEVLDPNSFKRLHKIEFNKEIRLRDLEYLGGDSIVVVGREFNRKINLIIGDLEKDNFIQDSLNTGFSLSRALKVGDKLIVGGIRYQENAQYIDSKLAIFDIDNISNDGMHIIHDKMNLFNVNSDFVVDKNDKVWFIAYGNDVLCCFCIDPQTEKIIQAIPLPYTISSLNDLSYALDNTGSTIYIRSHKAFYTIDVDSPVTPDGVTYEYTEQTVANLVELKMTKTGTLLVIDQVRGSEFNGSRILEFKPETTDDWKIINKYELPDIKASSIYVARYEK